MLRLWGLQVGDGVATLKFRKITLVSVWGYHEGARGVGRGCCKNLGRDRERKIGRERLKRTRQRD